MQSLLVSEKVEVVLAPEFQDDFRPVPELWRIQPGSEQLSCSSFEPRLLGFLAGGLYLLPSFESPFADQARDFFEARPLFGVLGSDTE